MEALGSLRECKLLENRDGWSAARCIFERSPIDPDQPDSVFFFVKDPGIEDIFLHLLAMYGNGPDMVLTYGDLVIYVSNSTFGVQVPSRHKIGLLAYFNKDEFFHALATYVIEKTLETQKELSFCNDTYTELVQSCVAESTWCSR